MIGKNYNKKLEQGQVLLITVMLLATAITIVMTVAFNTTTDTQITLLEQESQKALSAAEAGLELALKNSPGAAISLSDSSLGLTGITGKAEVLTTSSSTFVSPFVQKDEIYTFYLGDYQTTSPVGFTGTYFTGNISLYFGEKACGTNDGTVLEITQVKNDNTLLTRYLVDPCDYINNSSSNVPESNTIEDTVFHFKSDSITVSGDTKLLLIRVLYNGTKIAAVSSDSTKKLPLQGKTVVSEAKTTTGVTKRIQLFQSYPQIPTDFFVTGF